MGLFQKLFKKKPSIALVDPIFGPITYEQGIWTFLPTNPQDGCMITVAAPETGPSDIQRTLFNRLHSELAIYEQRARDFMAPHVEETVDISRLSIYSIEVGDDEETEREEFVLEFSDEEAFIIHRVSFKAGQPVDYGFDD